MKKMEIVEARKYLPEYYKNEDIEIILNSFYALSNLILDDKELRKQIKKED